MTNYKYLDSSQQAARMLNVKLGIVNTLTP